MHEKDEEGHTASFMETVAKMLCHFLLPEEYLPFPEPVFPLWILGRITAAKRTPLVMMGQAVNVYCKCRSSVRNYNLRQNNLIQSTSAWRHPRAVFTGSEVVMESLNMFSAFGSWRSWLLNRYLLLSLFVKVIIKKKNQKPEKLSFSSHPEPRQAADGSALTSTNS